MNARQLTFMLLVFSAPAYAHGEEVLLFPIGQIVGLVIILLLTKNQLRSISGAVRWAGWLVALVSCIPLWFVPGNFMPDLLRHTGWGNFISGLFPPLFIGGVVCYVVWRMKSTTSASNTAFNPDAPNRRAG